MAATRRHPDRDRCRRRRASRCRGGAHHRGGRRGQAAPSPRANVGRNVAILAPIGPLLVPPRAGPR